MGGWVILLLLFFIIIKVYIACSYVHYRWLMVIFRYSYSRSGALRTVCGVPTNVRGRSDWPRAHPEAPVNAIRSLFGTPTVARGRCAEITSSYSRQGALRLPRMLCDRLGAL